MQDGKEQLSDIERADRLEGASIEAANEALKALLLINGGACVAILGFMATAMGNSSLSPAGLIMVQTASRSLRWFALGAALAVFTSVFAYLCNQEYAKYLRDPESHPTSWRTGGWLNQAGVACALLSLVLFVYGAYANSSAMF